MNSVLHTIGVYLFTKGFLLTRLVLDHKSTCSQPPLTLPGQYDGCWYPEQFDKAVIIIVDALRYDFTIPSSQDQHYLNALTVLHESALETPRNAFLLPFIADPPTTTLQRLKGLTTGTLPTFIDAGSNFAGTAIEEDNLVDQLYRANKTLVHLGDDTWQALFPGYFDQNLSHAYDSLNVWDLHTVDDGVTEHLIPLLEHEDKWDVVFGHYLGVDHAGHRYGPDHPAMASKLRQMDNIIRQMMASLDDGTLLVVMGDHGMDAKGDHGGESDDEVEAALWMYSKKGIFGRAVGRELPPPTAKVRPVAQIDLVPTLSLLLGIPIPYNNLGAPIGEAFIGSSGDSLHDVVSVNALTAAQIHRYQLEYARARGIHENATSELDAVWRRARTLWNDTYPLEAEAVLEAFMRYQAETLLLCRRLWARFDIPNMVEGIILLLAAVAVLISFHDIPHLSTVRPILQRLGLGSFLGIIPGITMSYLRPTDAHVEVSLLGFTFGGILGYFSYMVWNVKITSPLPTSLWGCVAFVFTTSQSIGFASNSYTIWEDEILLFFIASFAFLSVVSSLRQANSLDRLLGLYHSFVFLLITRLASLSRLCREEQMPSCKSTYYASALSSTSATWQLLIPYIVAIMLPAIIKSHYQTTRSYEGWAIFWIGFALRMGFLGSAIYWTLDASDDGNWFEVQSDTLKNLRIIIAQFVLAIAFAAGSTTFLWAPSCARIDSTWLPSATGAPEPSSKSIKTVGLTNVHGTRYFLLVTNWLLAISLVQKPMGAGAIALLGWQILSLLEIISTNKLSQRSICPVVFGLLGSFYFFKTGHQATLASIQWDSAFVALKTIRYPWSPMLVLLNTFGSQMITTIAVPLLVLWKRPSIREGLLRDVFMALSLHLSYYSVINIATTIWAAWLRRHLMLYRIFSPRFLTGAAALFVVEIIGLSVVLFGIRQNTLSVAAIIGRK